MSKNVLEEAPPAVQRMFADIYEDIQLANQKRELEAIRKDPKAHRLTTIMSDKGSSYRYVDGGKDHTGRTVHFCWSCWQNVAGYYLAWKEIHGVDGQGERVGWTAHKRKKHARAFAERWRDEFKAEIRKRVGS